LDKPASGCWDGQTSIGYWLATSKEKKKRKLITPRGVLSVPQGIKSPDPPNHEPSDANNKNHPYRSTGQKLPSAPKKRGTKNNTGETNGEASS
jgi:hypothetical protein